MGLLEFDKLPINTLVGADWKTFKAVTANKTIDKGFRNKYFLTKSVCRLLSLLQPFENLSDRIPEPDALGAAFLQEEHGVPDARQASDR